MNYHQLFTLFVGTAVHQHFQEKLLTSGLLDPFFHEKEILLTHSDKTPLVTGHVDGVTEPLIIEEGEIAIHPEGKRHLIELKTIRDRPATEIHHAGKSTLLKTGQRYFGVDEVRKELDKSGLSMLRRPRLSHLAQASVYCHALGLEDILFVYMCPNFDPSVYGVLEERYPLHQMLGPIRSFIAQKDPSLVERSVERAQQLLRYVEEEITPPMEPYHALDKFPQCEHCEYYEKCYDEEPPD